MIDPIKNITSDLLNKNVLNPSKTGSEQSITNIDQSKNRKDYLELSESFKSNIKEDKSNPKGLSEEEQAEVKELKKIDAKVKRHEQAHLAAAAGLSARGPFYQYKSGPDGKRYAVGGEVRIDNSPEKDPQETIRKMQRVRAAALAPADPSPQDRNVASKASRTESKARQELAKEKIEERKENSSSKISEFKNDQASNKRIDDLIENSDSLLDAVSSGKLNTNQIDNYA